MFKQKRRYAVEDIIQNVKWFSSDDELNQLFPQPIQLLARKHWTPLGVASRAANFLVTESKDKILDIGSGVGKFCLAAAHYQPNAFFYGVEQRKELYILAEQAKQTLHLGNVSFIHGNFTALDFKHYDHFYFFNSFYENLTGIEKIDNHIEYSTELFNYYNRYLYAQLELKQSGTRLVTFHCMDEEAPKGYYLADSEIGGLLKYWIKI